MISDWPPTGVRSRAVVGRWPVRGGAGPVRHPAPGGAPAPFPGTAPGVGPDRCPGVPARRLAVRRPGSIALLITALVTDLIPVRCAAPLPGKYPAPRPVCPTARSGCSSRPGRVSGRIRAPGPTVSTRRLIAVHYRVLQGLRPGTGVADVSRFVPLEWYVQLAVTLTPEAAPPSCNGRKLLGKPPFGVPFLPFGALFLPVFFSLCLTCTSPRPFPASSLPV